MDEHCGFVCQCCDRAYHFTCVSEKLDQLTNKNGTLKSEARAFLSCGITILACPACVRKNNVLAKIPASLGDGMKMMSEEVKAIRKSVEAVVRDQETVKEQVTSINTFLGKDAENDDPSSPKPSYAAMARKGGNLAALVSTVIQEASVKNAEAELRARSVVVDNLPQSRTQTDREQVEKITSALGINATIVDVHRMGKPEGPGSRRPRKLKVVLATIQDHARLTAPETRYRLRQQELEEEYPKLYINPSRSSQDRHRLWLLRRRRDHLNSNIKNIGSQWIVDSRRLRLWKKVGGDVDRNIADSYFEDWAAEFEETYQRNQARQLPTSPYNQRHNDSFHSTVLTPRNLNLTPPPRSPKRPPSPKPT